MKNLLISTAFLATILTLTEGALSLTTGLLLNSAQAITTADDDEEEDKPENFQCTVKYEDYYEDGEKRFGTANLIFTLTPVITVPDGKEVTLLNPKTANVPSYLDIQGEQSTFISINEMSNVVHHMEFKGYYFNAQISLWVNEYLSDDKILATIGFDDNDGVFDEFSGITCNRLKKITKI